MISVYVLDNGDVAYRCTVCDITMYVEFRLHTSPFWDEYLGTALMRIMAHYMEAHSSVNSLPRNSRPETEAIGNVEYRTRRTSESEWSEWSELPAKLLFSHWYQPDEFEFRGKA